MENRNELFTKDPEAHVDGCPNYLYNIYIYIYIYHTLPEQSTNRILKDIVSLRFISVFEIRSNICSNSLRLSSGAKKLINDLV